MKRNIKVVKVFWIDYKNKISIREYPNKNGQYSYSNQEGKKGYHFKCNLKDNVKYGDIVLLENGVGIGYGLVINIHKSIEEFLEDKNGRNIPIRNVLGVLNLESIIRNRTYNIKNYAEENNLNVIDLEEKLDEYIWKIQNRDIGYTNLELFIKTLRVLDNIENYLYRVISTTEKNIYKFIGQEIGKIND